MVWTIVFNSFPRVDAVDGSPRKCLAREESVEAKNVVEHKKNLVSMCPPRLSEAPHFIRVDSALRVMNDTSFTVCLADH